MNIKAKAQNFNKETTKGIVTNNKIAAKDRLKDWTVEVHDFYKQTDVINHQ